MRNYFLPAVVISLLFHTLLITGFPEGLGRNKTPLKKIKESSREISLLPEAIKKISRKEPTLPAQKKPLPYTDNVMDNLITNKNISSFRKPQIITKNTKKIVFSESFHLEKSLRKNPAYMNYYRLIREKIRKNTYSYYKNDDKGKVFLNFVVLKSGELQSLFLGPDSVASSSLKEITLASVKNAAPFPPFPEELKSYAHLKFSIPIYFKAASE